MARRPGPAPVAVLACIAVALAAAACGGQAPVKTRPSATASRPSAGPTAATGTSGPPASCAGRVFRRMSMAQRAGQLFIVGLPGDQLSPATAATITSHHFGSVQFITTSTAGVAAIQSVSRAVQALSSAGATAGTRFFIAANQEGGEVQALQGPGFSAMPAAVDQGLEQPGLLQQQAASWGGELRAAGVNLNFAPVMDVVPAGTASQNQPIGALDREYGATPADVAAHGAAFIRGMAQAGIAATAKHFPGLGRVRGNTDFSSGVTDTVTTRTGPYLQPFRAAVGAGVPFVMVALATYTRIDPSHLAVFSRAVVTGMLRGELGFRGVAVSDDLGAAVAVASVPPGERAVSFLAAGGDMITSKYPGTAVTMERAVLTRAAADPGFRQTVDAAVMHVLAAKQAAGLLPCG